METKQAEKLISVLDEIEKNIDNIIDIPDDISKTLVKLASLISSLSVCCIQFKQCATDRFLDWRSEGKTIKDSEMLMRSSQDYYYYKLIQMKIDAIKEDRQKYRSTKLLDESNIKLKEEEEMLTRSIAQGQKQANDDARIQERVDAERMRVAQLTGKNPKKINCTTRQSSNGYVKVKCK